MEAHEDGTRWVEPSLLLNKDDRSSSMPQVGSSPLPLSVFLAFREKRRKGEVTTRKLIQEPFSSKKKKKLSNKFQEWFLGRIKTRLKYLVVVLNPRVE